MPQVGPQELEGEFYPQGVAVSDDRLRELERRAHLGNLEDWKAYWIAQSREGQGDPLLVSYARGELGEGWHPATIRHACVIEHQRLQQLLQVELVRPDGEVLMFFCPVSTGSWATAYALSSACVDFLKALFNAEDYGQLREAVRAAADNEDGLLTAMVDRRIIYKRDFVQTKSVNYFWHWQFKPVKEQNNG